MISKIDEGNAFEIFNDSTPKGIHPTAQLLFNYEKHYMQLLTKHKEDIGFINQLLKELRTEQEESTEKIVELERKLIEQSVDEEVKNIWLKHLAENLSRSFQLSNELVSHYMIMENKAFMAELKKRLND